MRFMMLMIPDVYQGGKELGPDFAPDVEAVEAMMKFNEDLANAGALISLDGLQPPSNGTRVTFAGGKPTATDGPFAEAKEVVGGYWIFKADSKEEAVEWAKKVPAGERDVIELRPIFEVTDWPEDLQQAADSAVVREAVGQHNA